MSIKNIALIDWSVPNGDATDDDWLEFQVYEREETLMVGGMAKNYERAISLEIKVDNPDALRRFAIAILDYFDTPPK